MRIQELISEAIRVPRVLYHGTRNKITQFKPLTHFGTFRAADDRLEHTSTGGPLSDHIIYKVRLTMNNPATMFRDIYDNHSLKDYLAQLLDSRVLTREQYSTITSPEQLVAALHQAGYDGITYKNRWEDPGSQSYIILNPGQVEVLDTITWETPNKIFRLRRQGR